MATPKPIGDFIFIEIEQAKLGGLDTSSMKTGVEWGIIKKIGPDVQNKDLKVGDKVFVKAWSTDSILYESKEYHFTSEARKGIVAVIK